MKRSSVCEKTGRRRGTWTPDEDRLLTTFIERCGGHHLNWRELPIRAGLSRCGKSCRLRWMNYLHPNIKRGHYTREENELIINLHAELGNRWSAITACLPGRTDNEIKNHWHTNLRKPTRRTSIVKETIPMPNLEHEALGRESAVPANNCVHPHDLTSLILESSAVLPMSPPKSSDFSSSSTYDFEEFIGENHQAAIKDDSEISSEGFKEFVSNFWNEPFFPIDPYKVDNTMPVFLNDLCNGYDMDKLFDSI